jgi:hypothetical protein
MALINKLSAIGDAIRGKTGGTEKLTLDAMPEAINSITTGGAGGDIEPIVLTGNLNYDCVGGLSGICFERFGNIISTKDITSAQYTFQYNTANLIPFDLNFKVGTTASTNDMFQYSHIKTLPKFNNLKPDDSHGMFSSCYYLREVPEDIDSTWDWSYVDNLTSNLMGNRSGTFPYCYSLRKVPMSFLNHGSRYAKFNYCVYYNLFENCYALDEVINLPFPHLGGDWSVNNALSSIVRNCYRLKNFTFALQEGTTPTPYTVYWQTLTLDLSSYVGYAQYKTNILDYNSGITADKEVKDDTTYQALKNDEDWFTCNIAYSRYNHDSAVATINSLPFTKGNNTIKFKGASGSATDGGAINTMTEEEIAVATAKGWTVSYV